MDTLQDTLNTWTYFVNWERVYSNLDSIIIELNILNSLIGSTNFENDLSLSCADIQK
ncbi:MAG: hypothetical protein GX369_03580 [Euryarchaeota archaeon]|nr:hypothetical protein [Euryarchaeota archaeon]